MKLICAWCGSLEGEKKPFSIDEKTHTLCQKCYLVFKKHIEGRTILEEFTFLQQKTERINKWVEKALYERTVLEKNRAVFHALKLLVGLRKCLEQTSVRLKIERGGSN